MDQTLLARAERYASRHRLRLREPLGSGIHGNVLAAEGNGEIHNTAVKVHKDREPYAREKEAYERLRRAGLDTIEGFEVPQLIRADDELMVIEMTIVTRPFVLDFAGAYLDSLPEFPEDVWSLWEAERRELFEDRWPQVRRVLRALEILGIHMIDVRPGNITFADDV